MPVWISWRTDPIRAHWLTVLIVVDFISGWICFLAPAGNDSEALLYTSGSLLLASATLVAVGFNVIGAGLGGLGWSALVAVVVLAVTHWTALAGVIGVALGLIAFYHALIMWDVGTGLDRMRHRRQTRR